MRTLPYRSSQHLRLNTCQIFTTALKDACADLCLVGEPVAGTALTSAGARILAVVLPQGVLCALGTALMFSVAPPYRSVPGRDSGVFLYIASGILNGQMPYRDVWDHKPPAIYYLDALALFLSGHSTWGVWAMQTLFVCSAIGLCFALLRRALGLVPAIFGSLAWISMFALMLIWDNYPEEYALPLHFSALYLFYNSEQRRQAAEGGVQNLTLRGARVPGAALTNLCIGALIAACSLLKQTLIGPEIALVLVLVSRRIASARFPATLALLRELGCIGTGALLVIAPVITYFWANRALGQAVDAVFRYNLAYSSVSFQERLVGVLSGVGGLPALSGTPAIALISWFRLMGRVCRRVGLPAMRLPLLSVSSDAHRCDAEESNRPIAGDGEGGGYALLSSLGLVGLPIEFVLTAASGHDYGYYYTAWLPMLAVLCALFARDLARGKWEARDSTVSRGSFVLLPVALVMLVVPCAFLVARVTTVAPLEATRIAAVRFVSSHTSPGERVLIWGNELGVAFSAGRLSSSRFIYQYPLLTRGYSDDALIGEFLRDIQQSRPSLVVDASAGDNITPPIYAADTGQLTPPLVYYTPADMTRVLAYFRSHYEVIATVGPVGWPLYGPTPLSDPPAADGR